MAIVRKISDSSFDYLMGKFNQYHTLSAQEEECLTGVTMYVKDKKIVRAVYHLSKRYGKRSTGFRKNFTVGVSFKSWDSSYNYTGYRKI